MRPADRGLVLLNCFALVVPVLLLNLLLTDRLPQAMFGREVFWQHIPPAVAYGENVLRAAVIAIPLLIPLCRAGCTPRAPRCSRHCTSRTPRSCTTGCSASGRCS